MARSGIDGGVDALHDGLPRSLDAGVWQVGVLTVGEKDDHQLLVGIDEELRPRESDFPTTTGAFDTTCNGGIVDAFVTKLNASGRCQPADLL